MDESGVLMKHKLHIPFAGREDLLRDAVASVEDIGTVHVWCDGVPAPKDIPRVDEWKQLPPMPYTSVHNTMFQYSLDSGDEVMFVMHADGRARPGVARLLREYVQLLLNQGDRDWGVIFTHYDVLCAFNMKAVRTVGFFDPMFYFYMGDCDYYYRMRKAGFRQIELGADGVEHRCEPQADVAPFKDGVGSATIKSNAQFNHIIQWRHMTKVDEEYYRFKWGGDPEHETFNHPYNGRARP